MVFKPWGERKRTVFQMQPEIQQNVSKIPGIRTSMVLPPALPGGGAFPIEFVVASTVDPQRILDFAQQIQSILLPEPKIENYKVDLAAELTQHLLATRSHKGSNIVFAEIV